MKTVHVKNIDSDSLFLLKRLSEFNKAMVINKDTVTLKNIGNEEYASLLELKKQIKENQNKEIIIYE